jgi:hypothetical protein
MQIVKKKKKSSDLVSNEIPKIYVPTDRKGVEVSLLLQLKLGKRQMLMQQSNFFQISSQTSENLDNLAHERMPRS